MICGYYCMFWASRPPVHKGCCVPHSLYLPRCLCFGIFCEIIACFRSLFGPFGGINIATRGVIGVWQALLVFVFVVGVLVCLFCMRVIRSLIILAFCVLPQF